MLFTLFSIFSSISPCAGKLEVRTWNDNNMVGGRFRWGREGPWAWMGFAINESKISMAAWPPTSDYGNYTDGRSQLEPFSSFVTDVSELVCSVLGTFPGGSRC